MKMVQKIKNCRQCPKMEETGGLAGEAMFCTLKNNKEIPYNTGIPKWCPLRKESFKIELHNSVLKKRTKLSINPTFCRTIATFIYWNFRNEA